tara:strand:- start:382 stop:1260 length:879 start_codon:yes stop_codon:yes gene_type:complete
LAGAQGTRKTKKKTSDTLEGYVPPPTTTTTTPTETSWVSPPASLNTTPFTASSKKPTSVFTTPTTYTTPSQPTFSTNSFNPSLYSTNIYSQLASVDSLATADAKTIQNQKFLRGQAATQARTELQQAKLEAETQQIPDRLSEPRTIVSDFDRTRGQAQKMTFVDPVQERVDSTNMGGFWGGDPMVQKAPTSDLEMQLNLALSSVRIDDSQKRIDDYQTQMARLQHTMESEEAKMRTKPQRRGFSGYSESFFMNESALWRDAKHEKDELEKIIGKEQAHLDIEVSKKEDWENV